MNLILIESDSKVLLDQKLKEIIGDSTNKITYQKTNSIEEIIEEASYVSLLEEQKYLIIKNADYFGSEKLNDKDTEKLLIYLENPYQYTTMIFTTYNKIDSRKSITKKIQEKGEFYYLEAPRNYELNKEIKKMLKNYKIGEESIKYIIDACLGNYDIIVNELSKLELLNQDQKTLTLEQLKQVITPNVNDNVFKFVDCVIEKDMYHTFKMLNDMESMKLDVLQLMNVLIREYRLMLYYKILEGKKYPKISMLKELKLQDWQLDKIKKEASKYHQEDLQDYIVELSKLDTAIKSGEYDKNLAFKSFLVTVFEY